MIEVHPIEATGRRVSCPLCQKDFYLVLPDRMVMEHGVSCYADGDTVPLSGGLTPTQRDGFGWYVQLDTGRCRACRKFLIRLKIGLGLAYFHPSLTSESPKQNPSSRFCSCTVQAPAKPKPLRSHSMASNPWMDRRAVLKLRKPPTRGMFFFSLKWSLSIPCWRCLVT